jgi:hypothetical protein
VSAEAARAGHQELRATDVATELGVSDRTARELLNGWVSDGWLVIADPSRRGRRYALSAEYRQLIGTSSADEGSGRSGVIVREPIAPQRGQIESRPVTRDASRWESSWRTSLLAGTLLPWLAEDIIHPWSASGTRH